jgi:hypothetical protein
MGGNASPARFSIGETMVYTFSGPASGRPASPRRLVRPFATIVSHTRAQVPSDSTWAWVLVHVIALGPDTPRQWLDKHGARRFSVITFFAASLFTARNARTAESAVPLHVARAHPAEPTLLPCVVHGSNTVVGSLIPWIPYRNRESKDDQPPGVVSKQPTHCRKGGARKHCKRLLRESK